MKCKNAGRIAPVMVLAVAVSIFACSQAAGPDRSVGPIAGTVSFELSQAVPGLVAAFGFDEPSGVSTTDGSGNGNNGSFGRGVTRTQAGRFGSALVFDGSGMITVASAPSLDLAGGMTLEAWVNPSIVDNAWRDIVNKGTDRYYLMVSSDNGARAAAAATLAGTTGTTKAFAPSSLPANAWTHVSATYDGAVMRLYLNGALVSSTPRSGLISTSIRPLTIGGDPDFGQYFIGTIDEVRIYNRALSESEIEADMTTPVARSMPLPDTEAPTIQISSPMSGSTYETTATVISLSGTASDNTAVTQVSWANDRGGAGTASGTSAWIIEGLTLATGPNLITVTARDSANNTATATMVVSVVAPPATRGLVAAFGFDEAQGNTVIDVSPSANSGTLGTGITRSTAGRFGGALAFAGTGMVTVPATSALNLTSAMTLEAWVRPSAIDNSWRDVVYKGRDRYYLMVSSDHGSRPAAAGTLAGTIGTTKVFGPTTLSANTWTHLAATYDGSAIRLFVNGMLVSTTLRAGTLGTSTSPLTIGGDATFGQFFRGLIDEVRIYNRALGAAEIATDMASAIGQPIQSGDTQAPSIAITIPTTASTYSASSNLLSLGGTASDNVGVAQIAWSSDRGGSGVATGTSNWTANGIALSSGSNVITVTARDGASNVATAIVTVTYAPTVTKLAITAQPAASAPSGSTLTQQPAVQLRNASNVVVPQSGVIVTAAIVSGGGTLSGTATATTDPNGVATFANLVISGTVGPRTIGFTAPNVTAAISNVVNITSGPASKIVITTPPSSVAVSGTPFATQPIIQLRDAWNNPVGQAGSTVSAALASGSGTLTGTATAVTNSTGAAAFTSLAITGAGNYTLSFSAPGLGNVVSPSVVVSAPTDPVGSGEPTYSAATDKLIVQDSFDAYTGVTSGASPFSTRYPSYRALDASDSPTPMSTFVSLVAGRSGQALRLKYGGSSGASDIIVGTEGRLRSVGSWNGTLPQKAGPYTHFYFTTWIRFSAGADPAASTDGTNDSGVKGVMIWNNGGAGNERYQHSPHRLKDFWGGRYAETRWDASSPHPPNSVTGLFHWRTADGAAPKFAPYADGNWHRFTVEIYGGDPSHRGERWWLDGVLVFDNVDNVGNVLNWAGPNGEKSYTYTAPVTHWMVFGNYVRGDIAAKAPPFTVDFDDWIAWTK